MIILMFALVACQDDRGCNIGESQADCDARLSGEGYVPPVNASVAYYRCESNRATLNQSRMLLINAGLDVKSSHCADLNTPHIPQPVPCDGLGYTQADIHIIPYVSITDALSIEGSNFEGIYSHRYTIKECT